MASVISHRVASRCGRRLRCRVATCCVAASLGSATSTHIISSPRRSAVVKPGYHDHGAAVSTVGSLPSICICRCSRVHCATFSCVAAGTVAPRLPLSTLRFPYPFECWRRSLLHEVLPPRASPAAAARLRAGCSCSSLVVHASAVAIAGCVGAVSPCLKSATRLPHGYFTVATSQQTGPICWSHQN